MKNHARNVLAPPDIREYFAKERPKGDFNYGVHEQLHKPAVVTWTSKETLAAETGARIYPYRGGQLIRARANIQVAAAGTVTWRILKNGTTIHAASPTIAAGNLYANVTEFLENGVFVPDDYFQVELVDVSDATGPLVVIAEYIPTDFV